MTASRSERGSVSTEFAVVMTAFLTSFMLLVVFAGRVSTAENNVQSAAQEAARSASLSGTPESAVAAAQQTAMANLAIAGLTCAAGLDVAVDTAQFAAGCGLQSRSRATRRSPTSPLLRCPAFTRSREQQLRSLIRTGAIRETR